LIRLLPTSLSTVPINVLKWLAIPLAALITIAAGDRALGNCAACGDPVIDGDGFLRYRGEYYHAGDCVDYDPPALRNARARTAARHAR
jgi:hypothetical protein